MDDRDLLSDFDLIYSENSRLRGELAALLEEYEYINRFMIPMTITVYLIQIGALKLELLRAQVSASKIRRRIALVRDDVSNIDAAIHAEFKQWDDRLRYEASEVDAAKARFSAMTPSEDIGDMREAYRALSKKMNPEVNSARSEAAGSFWPSASMAYAWKDSFQLKALLLMSEDYPESYEMPFNIEESRRINIELKERIKAAARRLDEAKEHPAFEWRRLLDSPERLAKEQASLRDQISRERMKKTALEDLLKTIEDKKRQT